MSSALSRESVPERIGDYRVIRPLGEGLMGWVYLGKKEEVIDAIKVLDLRRARELPLARRFEGGEIFHDYVVRYKEIGYDERNRPYLVFNYLKVFPLQRSNLPQSGSVEVIDFFIEVGDALEKLHGSGLVHGNLKPSNLMVRRGEDEVHPYFSDIGLDYVYRPENFQGVDFWRVFPYMAPERIRLYLEGGEVKLEPAMDIYSFGVLLFETLSGRRMFLRSTSLEGLLEEKREGVDRYRLVGVTFPRPRIDLKALNELIRCCLSFMPEDRPSIVQVLERLRVLRLVER